MGMHVNQSLKRKDRAFSVVRDIYLMARECGWTCSAITEHLNQRLAPILQGCPYWVTAYINGVRDAMHRELYRNDLLFGAYINGVFYCTDKTHPLYYEKQGIDAQTYCEKTRSDNLTVSHYWRMPHAGVYKKF